MFLSAYIHWPVSTYNSTMVIFAPKITCICAIALRICSSSISQGPERAGKHGILGRRGRSVRMCRVNRASAVLIVNSPLAWHAQAVLSSSVIRKVWSACFQGLLLCANAECCAPGDGEDVAAWRTGLETRRANDQKRKCRNRRRQIGIHLYQPSKWAEHLPE